MGDLYHFLTGPCHYGIIQVEKEFSQFQASTKITRMIGPLQWFKNVCDKIAQLRQLVQSYG